MRESSRTENGAVFCAFSHEGGKIQVLSDCAIGGAPEKGAQAPIKFGAQMLYIQGEMTEKHIIRETNFKIIEDALAFLRKEGHQADIGARPWQG